jgi:uncharacterized protein
MIIDGYCSLGVDREYDLTETALLHAMDSAGVEKAVIAPPDRYLAVYNHDGNELVRRAVEAHPDRFIGTCSANPWYGKSAVVEVRRALDDGARFLVLHPWVQGFTANDELVFPLLEEASRQKVPVYLHTGLPGNSTPWQVVDLAEQFRSTDFIMGHCGATDFWNDVVNAGAQCENIYLESSLARPFHFARYMEKLGRHKGIMGSWSPLNDFCFEWEQMRKFTPADVFNDISGNNLARLLEKRESL